MWTYIIQGSLWVLLIVLITLLSIEEIFNIDFTNKNKRKNGNSKNSKSNDNRIRKKKAIKRAKKVGFKSKYPTTPDDLTTSTYMGYKKKVRNWRRELKQFEKSSLNY